nr:glutamine synthetase type III [Bacteroidota bacterium]
GVNGSGKHCNWSIGTDTGVNLLSPGETPQSNLQFLTFFVNTIKAVYDHADLLRATIASAANDHRLGANEAPPAIISIFIGQQLTNVLEELEGLSTKSKGIEKQANDMLMSVPTVPEIRFDNTDRNRTSPFAFTGNKFEFRAVGSSSNTSPAMIALNTIVANQLKQFRTEVDSQLANGGNLEQVILKTLKGYITASKNILFEGNNYSEEWKEEAKRRGQSNIQTTPEALDSYVSKKTVKLFEEIPVFTHRELEARHEIKLEMYAKQIQIESRIMGEIALTHIIPAAVAYQSHLLDLIIKQQTCGLEKQAENMKVFAGKIATHVSEMKENVFAMIDARKKANLMEDAREKAIAYCHEVKPFFDTIRYHADKLELYVDDNKWPLPKYRELLFVR